MDLGALPPCLLQILRNMRLCCAARACCLVDAFCHCRRLAGPGPRGVTIDDIIEDEEEGGGEEAGEERSTATFVSV